MPVVHASGKVPDEPCCASWWCVQMAPHAASIPWSAVKQCELVQRQSRLDKSMQLPGHLAMRLHPSCRSSSGSCNQWGQWAAGPLQTPEACNLVQRQHPGSTRAAAIACRRGSQSGSIGHGSRGRGRCGAGCGTTSLRPSQRNLSSAAAWRRCCCWGCDLIPHT
jgi:hypothetical protein